MYVVKAEATGVAMEVSVNDVPLAELSGSSASNRLGFASPWITEPSGVLSARILPAAREADRPIERSARALLVELPDDFTAGEPDGPVIAEIDWRAAAGDTSEPLPATREARFVSRPAPPMRWQRSRLPGGSATEQAALVAWIAGLNDAVGRGDVEHFVRASEPGLRDLAEAMGHDPDEQIAELIELLSLNFPVAGLKPIRAEDLAFRPVAHGRLLVVTRKDGEPVITTESTAPRQYRYNLRAGLVDRQWWAF
jgi:hypothetical protein